MPYGNGNYTVGLWEETSPNSDNYKKIRHENVNVNVNNPLNVFLQSNVNMNWDSDMECIKYAKTLTSTLKTANDKINAIWKYIITNYSYDYNLASSVKYNYMPDIESIFKSKKDICFGLTSLFNSMLRSIGIPAKMMHGYFDNIYHAWSQVYDEKWITIDVTHDIAYHQAGMKLELEKNPNEYQVKYIY